ncbi:9602_t:CDS:1 [Dentiscutata heterogama]|uniref:9602_t:CDS:1 n=1 Tax=Dentiscutata heterogama TaxID=1316150 RepID=A0ACA9JXW4_9GLOM|nr:9602_t:CDS:1 [Dentiscutata heterogama]
MKLIFNLIIITFIATLTIFCPTESVSSNETIPFNKSISSNETIPFNKTISSNETIPFNKTFSSNETIPFNKSISSAPPPSGICLKSQVVANGTQIKTGGNPNGWCSSVIQGQIPTNEFMVSTLIIKPKDGSIVPANQNFTLSIKIINLQTGYFADPETEYYTQPQELNEEGIVKGHSHVVIQKLADDEDEEVVPNPNIFAFFRGLNDPADDRGILETEVGSDVEPGLPSGRYRVCTIVSTYTHQPVIMPIAQRGSQDDCIRFTVKS